MNQSHTYPWFSTSLLLQVGVAFAQGHLDEMRKAVEAMQAAGLEVAEARDKLMRVEEALKKVLSYPWLVL